MSILNNLLVIILLLPIYCNSQTCIIVATNKDSIVIGADSRRALVYYSETDQKKIIQSICKIHYEGNVYFAVAGKTDSISTLKARLAARKFKTPKEAADQYLITMLPEFEKYLKLMVSIKPQLILDYQEISVIFTGFVNGKPECYRVYLGCYSGVNKPIKIDTKIDPIPFVLAIGRKDEIAELINKGSTWRESTLAKTIVQLINIEIAMVPEEVAPPVDLLVIYKNGLKRWISKKQKCSN